MLPKCIDLIRRNRFLRGLEATLSSRRMLDSLGPLARQISQPSRVNNLIAPSLNLEATGDQFPEIPKARGLRPLVRE